MMPINAAAPVMTFVVKARGHDSGYQSEFICYSSMYIGLAAAQSLACN
jgi:hypothetical protein